MSELILGCMTYGDPGRGTHSWTLPAEEAKPFYRKAIEAGITTFDTANMYSDGTSEEITGQVLGEFARRDELVLTTKVFFPMRPGPHGSGLSRKHILWQIDESLRRLRTDYVDLYQIHRWDPETPIEETMETLHDVVRAGKARYIGASSMRAWQFAKAQHTADRGGWTRFVSMQDQYNLLQREEEREMHPMCQDSGVGVLAWSPLARGTLARANGTSSARAETDTVLRSYYRQTVESNRAIVDAVGVVAERHGVSRAQVALAWVRQRDQVTAPIIGATTLEHLEDAIASLGVTLEPHDIELLEAPYTPRDPEGYR
ncbi:aldo/keto reductase [Rhodococcus sp. NPDC058532]|uniref:aldo/keto reductase n=1 Tax=Rhodococcus sp. NPDC058532 TaxID=3346540 RepID=UPI00364AF12F